MNLQSKKARVPIAALGVSALICGAGALISPAFATGTTLSLLPSATSATITDLDPTVSPANAATGYGIALDGDAVTATKPLTMSVTGTTGGSVDVERVSGAGSPAYTAPAAATASTAINSAGDQTILVTSSATFTIGDLVKIGTVTNPEYGVVATIPNGTSITLTRGLSYGHASGVAVQDLHAAAYTPIAVNNTGVVPNYSSSDTVYLASATPGTYQVQLFQDNNNNGVYDSGTDYAAPAITLTVMDVNATTATTTDDLTYTVSAPSSSGIGQPLTASTTYGGLTTTDFRGSSNAGIPILGAKIAAEGNFVLTPTGSAVAAPASGAPTFDGTKFNFTSGNVTGTGTVATVATLGSAGTASASTTISDNTVTGVALAATAATGTVAPDATTPTTINVKTGTSAVTYTATATKAGPLPVAGVTVNFTVTGSAAEVADITTDGTTVSTSSTTSHVYSAVTNASGVASLTVTSSATAAATTYGVAAATNGHSGTALTALYGDAHATSVAITNTTADLTPAATTGVSVTLKGKVTDQFGAAYTGSSGSQQVEVYIGTTAVGCTPYSFAGSPTTASATGNAVLSSGVFTYVYTPATTPVAGSCTPVGIGYDVNSNGVIGATEGAVTTINWGSSATAATITITAPADASTGALLQAHTAITPGTAVTGTVADASNTALANKTVTLTGTDGVFFSTVANPLSTTATDDLTKALTTTTSSAGAIQNAYVFFTKTGTAGVTVTSGTATKTVTVTTATSADPYAVTVNDVTGDPGSTLIVSGKVTDMFGNPVVGSVVDLNLGASTVGTLGATSLTTNSLGLWSTTLTTGSNQSGAATLTATLHTQVANATPATAWLANAGLTFAAGDYTADGKVTITATDLVLTSTTKITGTGSAKVSGTFMPTTSVDIYSKASGADSYTLLDSLTTDSDGKYSASYPITKTTKFLAKSNGLSSPVDTTTVYSAVTLTGKALGRGKLYISANGAPSAKGTLTFYRSVAGKDPILKSETSNSSGNGTATVKLPKGTRSVYVIFKAPGTSAGTSKTLKIKVK